MVDTSHDENLEMGSEATQYNPWAYGSTRAELAAISRRFSARVRASKGIGAYARWKVRKALCAALRSETYRKTAWKR